MPPQRFSRSRGVNPISTCRPCFMPVPPVGFSPSRPNPLAERDTFSGVSTLMRFASHPLYDFRSSAEESYVRNASDLSADQHKRSRATSTRTHFRVLIPASVRAHPAALWATEKLATLMGFILHRGFPLRVRGPPEAYPLMSLTNGAQAKPLGALQSLADEEIGLTPSSLPPLPRFSHLIDEPRSSQR